MHKLIRQVTTAAAIVGAAALAPQALASTVVVDFESVGLTGFYIANDTFTQNYFTMTVDIDTGIVDTNIALIPNDPTGNLTQYYSQLNEGGLIVQRTGGGLFDLTSFDAAFVPLGTPASGTTVIVAAGVRADNSSFGVAWLFGGSNNSHFPFQNYSNPADFAGFTNVKLVEFFACSLNGGCASPTQNNGQFAIDNIALNFVPEPNTIVLALGLMGLMGLPLRRGRSNATRSSATAV